MNSNLKEISEVLKELHIITGFRISLHGIDFSEIAAYPVENLPFCKNVQSSDEGRRACLRCDRHACARAAKEKDTVIYTCRYGLVEAVSPLYDFGTLTGYLMMGQVLATADGAAEQSPSAPLSERIPRVSEKKIPAFVHIMTICARYLTLSNAVGPSEVTTARLAREYIHENLKNKITIADICSALGCSKTSLLSSFKREFGTTVNAYVTKKRLESARHMLASGVMSINEVAHASGFADQSYFSKVFSTEYGMPPSEYGKESEKK